MNLLKEKFYGIGGCAAHRSSTFLTMTTPGYIFSHYKPSIEKMALPSAQGLLWKIQIDKDLGQNFQVAY